MCVRAEPVVGGVWGPDSVAPPDCIVPGDDSDAKPLFGLKPDRHGDVEEISRMRAKEYTQTVGFIWHVGHGKAASKVQWRLGEAHMLKPTPAVPTVKELQEYLCSRFPNLSDQLEQVPFETSSSEDGHREGKWFRIILSDAFPCPDFQTSWHGSNLYVAGSIIKTGKMWPSYDASRRLFGIWSHKSSNRKLCGSYMYYILSGSGVAWSVMFELRIDLNHTQRGGSSSHQHCTEEGHATVHAAWFHGVTQDDFFLICIFGQRGTQISN